MFDKFVKICLSMYFVHQFLTQKLVQYHRSLTTIYSTAVKFDTGDLI